MRPLEAVVAVAAIILLAARLSRPRSRQTTLSLMVMLVIIEGLHLAIDGPRILSDNMRIRSDRVGAAEASIPQ